MKTRKLSSLTLVLAVAGGLALAAAFLAGCDKSQPEGSPGRGQAAEAKVVNAICPMMGTKLDPANVPANLTREFDGKKIGFCCPGCPAGWDKLPDDKKREKLQAAMAPAPK